MTTSRWPLTLGCLFSALIAQAQPWPDGPEQLLETPGRGPRVAADRAGNFVVVWQDATYAAGDLDVRGQRFPAGTVPGTPFQISTGGPYPTESHSPDVAITGGGSFVVVWNPANRIRFRRFDGAGEPLAAPVEVDSPPGFARQLPAVTGSPSGQFVVSWVDGSLFDYTGYVEARRFGADGSPLGPTFFIGEADYYFAVPDLAMSATDEFTVVWKDGGGTIHGQRYDDDGMRDGAQFAVNRGQHNGERGVISMAADGSFVVAWRGREQFVSDRGVFAQRFDGTGAADGARIEVSIPLADLLVVSRAVSVAHNDRGEMVVVWVDDADGRCCVFGQRYDDNGLPDGVEFQVNTSGTGSSNVDVAMDGDGNFMVVWGSDGSALARRYCGPLRLDDPSNHEVCVGASVDLNVGAAGRSPFRYQWRKDGMALEDGGAVSGARSATLTIGPVSLDDAGSYDAEVADSCATPTHLVSVGAILGVTSPPAEVSGLRVSRSGSNLNFHWTDVASADDYVVTEDANPEGPFSQVTGTAPSGTVGLTRPLPGGDRYYLVAGRNALCGTGPYVGPVGPGPKAAGIKNMEPGPRLDRLLE